MKLNDDRLYDRKNIITKLSTLVKHKCNITAHLSEDTANLSIAIIHIDSQDASIIFTLNCGTWEQELLSKQVMASSNIEFSTVFRNTQVAFNSRRIKQITHEGISAFIMDMPSSLFWQNRRKHDRKKIPVLHSSFCEIVLTVPSGNSTEAYKQNYAAATDKIKQKLLLEESKGNEFLINLIRLSLYDVSLSGCSILNYDPEFSYFFRSKTRYENCKIIMADDRELLVSFEVMSVRNVELPDGEFSELIGVKFLDIKRNVH